MSLDKASVVEYVDHPSKDDLQKAESDLPVHSELAAVLAKEKPRRSSVLSAIILSWFPDNDQGPWSRSMIKLYLIVFVAYLCSATNGFDSNTFGGASAMTSFEDYFSVHGGSKQGLIAASYVIGNMVSRARYG